MTTTMEPVVGVGIGEAANALGISPNAVRMRIRHKTLPAFKDGEQWRVLLDGNAPESGWSPTSDHESRPTSNEVDHSQVTPLAQAQFAAVIREAVAPFIEELGKVQRLLGATEQELRQERERRETIQQDYDVAKKELAALRMLARSIGNKRHEAREEPAAKDEAESPAKTPKVAPGGAERVLQASEQPRRLGWLARLLGWE